MSVKDMTMRGTTHSKLCWVMRGQGCMWGKGVVAEAWIEGLAAQGCCSEGRRARDISRREGNRGGWLMYLRSLSSMGLSSLGAYDCKAPSYQ